MKKEYNSIILFFGVLIFFVGNLFATHEISTLQSPLNELNTEQFSTSPYSKEKIDHSQWNKLLKKHVDKEGLVDYVGFKKDVVALDSYLKMLSENEPNQDWSQAELLAYYINLYNAATVKLIVENYPIKSIKDTSRPWSKERISIGDKKLSLDDIEHKILRKMNEPRIHFALNCASISCPKLSNDAYTANKIDEQLNRAAKEFINSNKNNISASNPRISSIFDWYKKDFKVNGKADIIAFINQYATTKISANAKISYMKYDWKLNSAIVQ